MRDHGIALDSTYGIGYESKVNACKPVNILNDFKHTPFFRVAGNVNVPANS